MCDVYYPLVQRYFENKVCFFQSICFIWVSIWIESHSMIYNPITTTHYTVYKVKVLSGQPLTGSQIHNCWI